MALFKILKGVKSNLPSKYVEGYCYFTTDEGKMYIDTTSSSSGRICLNAATADKLSVNAGSAINPVYFANGIPIKTTYTLGKSVPSDAKFTDTTYSNFVKSGSGAKAGLVPAPSTTAGTTKYLREDATWQTPPNYYHTRAYSSGLKISTGSGVSDLYIPVGNTNALGVVKQHTSADCTSYTSYTSDEGATTPAAVKKAFSLFTNDYAPKKDGTGATGTWGINISGNAATATSATKDSNGNTITSTYAKLASPNNLIHSSNEFTIVPGEYSGDVYINYRTTDGTNGNISSYRFCKGDGGTLADINAATYYQSGYGVLDTRNLSGTANKIAKFTSANTVGDSNITDDGSTVTVGTKMVVQGNGSSYNEGIRILPASNGQSNIFFSANITTSGDHDGGWLIGRRGAVGIISGAEGDFTIEEQSSSGANLTIHKNSGGATLQGIFNAMNGIVIGNGADLKLKAPSSNTTDSGDIIFANSGGTEMGRLWLSETTLQVRFGSTDNAKTLIHSGNYTDYFVDRYVNITGDTMTGLLYAHGGISLNASTPQQTPDYILGIKAFADGGNIIWQSAGSVQVGYADNAGSANLLDGIDSTGFLRYYSGSGQGLTNADVVNTPSYLWTVSATGGSIATATKPSGMDNAWGVLHVHTHNGDYATQLGFGGTTGQMYFRNAYNASSFGAWKTLLDSTNYSSYAVTLTTVQTISGTKTMTGGLKVSGRYISSGDDEGIVVGYANNGYAGLCLGEPSGKRSVFYLTSNGDPFWRYNNSSASYDIYHPIKSGTIALTSDLSNYLPLSGGTMSGEINMNNSPISNIGQLTFADPGAQEGITWTGGNGWYIYESPDDLTNAAGNLQFTHGSTRRLTIRTNGTININGTLQMSGPIQTSFKSSVAMGSYEAAATTIPDLVEELRYSSGAMGSVSLSTAYATSNGGTINAGWYNFIYSPHRSGGSSGAASGDNHKYGTLILSAMTSNDRMWTIRVSDGTIAQSKRVWCSGDSVTGAVWNDYAECRESDCEEFGYVLMEVGDDSLTKTTERLSHFAGISSDTWGFSQGETDKAKTPIAVAGRVLVYPYQDRNNYKPGDCVCAAPGGTVDIMTREEIINWPDRIVGTVSCVPDYEEWGGGEGADRPAVKVNGRIWIKVR